MRLRKVLCAIILALFSLQTLNFSARADEGMWPFNNLPRAEINNISAEAGKKNGLRNDVIALYQGGQYNLYTYKKYTDVRLVFAPEFEIAFLGGDPDNFEYPRYDLDLALFRVYENDRPIHSADFFKWSEQGSKEGDLVFVSGNPGRKNRLDTVAHPEYLPDFGIPLLLKYLQHLHDLYTSYGSLGAEQERRAHEDLFSADNSLKAYIGEEGAPGRGGLKDPSVISAKKKVEDELRKLVAANPKMQKEYGDAWETIAKERKELPSYER